MGRNDASIGTRLFSVTVHLSIIFVADGFSPTGISRINHARHRFAPVPGRLSTVKGQIDPTVESPNVASIPDTSAGGAFETIASLTLICLLESHKQRESLQPNSATNWVDQRSSFLLEKTFDKLCLKLPDDRSGNNRDEAATWIRWMKSAPAPVVIEMSDAFRDVASRSLSPEATELYGIRLSDILSRMSCRLILLPSGSELRRPVVTPDGGLVYGKLLYGGVRRFRIQTNGNGRGAPRRVGERTSVKSSRDEKAPAWLQYGGRDRQYEALDVGAAAVLEVSVLPQEKRLADLEGDMALSRLLWDPEDMFSFEGEGGNGTEATGTGDFTAGDSAVTALSGLERNDAFQSTFQSSVGGLQPQIDAIIRRVLDGRVIRPAIDNDDDDDGNNNNNDDDPTPTHLASTKRDAQLLQLLNLTPVRGLLLYGPPGCGKTALARTISHVLRTRAPKIVSAPELLDRWVGGSEARVRELFAEAEAELASCGNDPTKSALHVIVIDEIDAVFRKRSAGEDSGEATRSSVVNQILTKLDGVKSLPNVLMIGMTNRKELLDEALLRPGRLEVQVEIPLPDKEGRREIMGIHFGVLRRRGRLSQPLCAAIDGAGKGREEGDNGRKRQAVKRAFLKTLSSVSRGPVYDLAADSVTDGFSGADIAGLVRCAGSIALARARKDGSGVDGLLITLEDVLESLGEIKR